MKAALSGDLLETKTVKYCNIMNGNTAKYMIIATIDGTIMIFDTNKQSDIVKCYRDEEIKQILIENTEIKDELLRYKVINDEYIKTLEKYRQEKLIETSLKSKSRRYNEYISLKDEFEKQFLFTETYTDKNQNHTFHSGDICETKYNEFLNVFNVVYGKGVIFEISANNSCNKFGTFINKCK